MLPLKLLLGRQAWRLIAFSNDPVVEVTGEFFSDVESIPGFLVVGRPGRRLTTSDSSTLDTASAIVVWPVFSLDGCSKSNWFVFLNGELCPLEALPASAASAIAPDAPVWSKLAVASGAISSAFISRELLRLTLKSIFLPSSSISTLSFNTS